MGDEWKWRGIKFTGDFYTPYEEGWARTKMITLG